jgi:uncharacterized membrane protein
MLRSDKFPSVMHWLVPQTNPQLLVLIFSLAMAIIHHCIVPHNNPTHYSSTSKVLEAADIPDNNVVTHWGYNFDLMQTDKRTTAY